MNSLPPKKGDRKESEIQPIPFPDWSGKQNRNFRRRYRYHVKKIEDEIEQVTGVNPLLLRKK